MYQPLTGVRMVEVAQFTFTPAAGAVPAADGFVAIATNTDSLFHRLATVIGAEWMVTDRASLRTLSATRSTT